MELYKQLLEYDEIVVDACIIIGIFEGNDRLKDLFNVLTNTKKLSINQISLYECRYLLKKKNSNSGLIDSLIDDFLAISNCKVYWNTNADYITASNIKADGGLSPYDALMLAQIQNSKKTKACLLTLDKEFDKDKFFGKYDIVFP